MSASDIEISRKRPPHEFILLLEHRGEGKGGGDTRFELERIDDRVRTSV